uniref:Uncharacterized protein n=1 Tax=Romanomermis culicivorax TaxID=13658 RepID=A0A915KFN7_ROMCU
MGRKFSHFIKAAFILHGTATADVTYQSRLEFRGGEMSSVTLISESLDDKDESISKTSCVLKCLGSNSATISMPSLSSSSSYTTTFFPSRLSRSDVHDAVLARFIAVVCGVTSSTWLGEKIVDDGRLTAKT